MKLKPSNKKFVKWGNFNSFSKSGRRKKLCFSSTKPICSLLKWREHERGAASKEWNDLHTHRISFYFWDFYNFVYFYSRKRVGKLIIIPLVLLGYAVRCSSEPSLCQRRLLSLITIGFVSEVNEHKERERERKTSYKNDIGKWQQQCVDLERSVFFTLFL